jgi:CheY-like chemotaxis protein
MKILVADDDQDLREALSEILVDAGHEVSHAESGHTAIEIIKNSQNSFDLVISDYYMSNGDGLALLNYLRGVNLNHPPFILITGQSDGRLNTILEKGAQEILHKPFSAMQILSLVDSFR